MNAQYLIACLFGLLCTSGVRAQILIFSNLTTEDGLSSNHVNTFLQDRRGFMWIGTKDGLNRYDGTTFQVYKNKSTDSTTLPNNQVVSLAEDRLGNIWVGTWQGVAKMDPYNGRVVRYQHRMGQKNSIGVNNANHVLCDSKGRIWVSNPHGVFLFREATQDFDCKLDLKSKQEYGLDIYEDRQGNFWVGTLDGVYFLHSQDFSHKKYVALPQKTKSNVVIGMREDAKGMLWLAMWGGGLACLNPHSERIKVYTQPKRCKGEFIATSIYEEVVDSRHRILWVAKYGELLRLDLWDDEYPKDLESATLYKHQKDVHYSYLEGEANKIYPDRNGNLWIGTNRGISRVIAQNQRFVYYPPFFGFGFTYMQYDTADVAKPFWAFAWYGHESCQLDTNLNVVKRWKTLPPKRRLDAGNIANMVRDKSGNIWLATFDGLARYTPKNGRFQWFEKEKDNLNSLFSNRTTGVYLVGEDLWVSLYNMGVCRYNPTTRQWAHYSEQKNCLPSSQIKLVYADKQQRVWLLTNSGIVRYDRESDDFEIFDSHEFLKSELADLIEQADGSFWLGGNSGICHWMPNTDSLRVLSVEDGLDNSKVVDMEQDCLGNLWILTENQLNLFRPPLKAFTHFGRENGFLSQTEGACIVKDKRGDLYIGAFNNQVCKFRPADFEMPDNPLPLYIEQFRVNGKPLVLKKTLGEKQEIRLRYDENQLQIDFTAIDFLTGSQVRYACTLGEGEGGWQEVGNRKFAAYVNVPPGSYVFRVKACDAMGNWGTEKSMSFVIEPPFWKTSNFKWGAGLLFLIAFGSLVRYLFTKHLREKILILEKERALERERNRISQDMHDDIGSGLSKIVIMSEVLKRQRELNENAKLQLQTISESAGELIDNMQHIVWFLHSNNDNMERFLTYLREYISKYLENIGIAYEYDFPVEISMLPVPAQVRRNIFLVVKEVLNNIAKYSQAVTVSICIRLHNNQITLILSDDGIGFDPQKTRNFGNGIRNMRERMTAIQGHFSLFTTIGEGTKVVLEWAW